MAKGRRRARSGAQGDDVSLLDGPDDDDDSLSRYNNLHVAKSSSSSRKSKGTYGGTAKRSAEAQSSMRLSALPPENRFVPQHDPRARPASSRQAGALQFVPAYEESTSPVITTKSSPMQEEAPAPTWDAIIEADSGIRGRSLSWGRKPKVKSGSKAHSADRSISSVESAGTGIFRRKRGRKMRGSPVRSGSSKSPGKRPLGTAVPRTSISPAKQRLGEVSRGNRVESASAVSAASSSRKGTRIARLASLFSSRSQVLKEEEVLVSTPDTKKPLMRKDVTPVSPPMSESSNDYTGWPGTQDKRGATVAIQSSYDDSSVGGPVAGPAGVSTFHRKKYELDLDDDAVEEEVRKWMNDPSFDDSTVTDRSSPRRRSMKKNASQESKSSSKNSSYESGRIMSEQSFTDEDENPADFHLAALVANASAAPRSPLAETTGRKQMNGSRSKRQSPQSKTTGSPGYSSFPRRTSKSAVGASSVVASSATGALSINNLFGDERKKRASPSRAQIQQAFNDDPWDVDEYERAPSSAGTSVSKSSSAFFQTRGVSDSHYGIRPNMRDISAITRKKSKSPTKSSPPKPEEIQPPTEEALARNERYSPAQRTGNAINVRGYRGYLDKTKDVPNLMDALDSESVASSKATSAYMPSNLHVQRPSPRGQASHDVDEEGSDIFDGLSATGTDVFSTATVEPTPRNDYNGSRIQEKPKGMNVVRLAGGLTAIQTTQSDLDKRGKAYDFDENLTDSSVDNFGYAKLPAFREMAAAGRRGNDTAKYIPPSSTALSPTGQPIREPITGRQLSTTPRSMFEHSLDISDNEMPTFSDNAQMGTLRGYYHGDLSEYCVNSRQAKQLVKRYRELCAAESKYLSREELVKADDAKKAFALLEMRSRVMEKDIERGLERQGGTVPVDDLVTTPFNQAAHRVRDAVIVSKAWRDGASPKDVVTASILTQAEERTYYVKRPIRQIDPRLPNYYLEPVTWLDDTDFTQLRCPSLGPRCMRGFEIFTIGDCQSILLKLTNERCMDLRHELNEATARQLEAEELMKEEGDAGDGMMTDAEMRYLASMEEVKTISKRLVVAEKAFELVRERIEKLVAKYETLLVKIENDSVVAPSSILTNGSSYITDGYDSNYSSEGEQEKIKLEKRALRAELRAEVAAREALMAKQEAQKVKEEKQWELEALQQKLEELQAESSTIIAEREREKTAVLAKTIAHETQSSVQEHTTPRISQEKINGVKQKFRDRMAERMRASPETNNTSPRRSPPTPETMARSRKPPPALHDNRLRQTAGEEILGNLDFYERSLKSVERSRAGGR